MHVEKKVMVTSANEGKPTRTLLYFNLVKKKKFNKNQDDGGSDRAKMCLEFCEA